MRKSQSPKISIIMSVYNGMPHLREAVKSILIQTYKNFEFIIINDGSKDKTWDYLKDLKDKRVKLIQNTKNLGLAASLNIALKKANGDYIARMDADDISLPIRLEEQIKFLLKNHSVDLCGSAVYLINEKGTVVGSKTRPTKDSTIKRTLGIYPCIIHPTFMGKKEFFTSLGGYRTEFDGAEEYDLLMRARNKSKFANLHIKLLKWRLRNDRRSIKIMQVMNKLDLKIKLQALKRGNIDIFSLYGYLKMFLMTYFLPVKIKVKLARFLKIA